MGDFNWSTMGFFVVGVGVLIAGVGIIMNYLQLHNPSNIFEGIVFGSEHVNRRDDKGNLIQDYYLLNIRYKKGNRIIPCDIKSSAQYEKDEVIRLVEMDGRPVIFPHADTSLVNGILFSLGGVLVFVTPFANSHLGTDAASLLLALVLICIGSAILHIHLSTRNYTSNPLEGEITELLLFQTGRENLKFVGGTKTYYPIITYTRNGITRRFVSKYGAGTENSYKVGQKVPLYWSDEEQCLVEKKPGKELLIIAAALIIFGLFGLISTLIK